MNPKTLRDLPLATIAVVATCVIAWLLRVFAGAPLMGSSTGAIIDAGGIVPLYVLTGEPWRLVTALFVHVDLVHIGLNMIIFGAMAPAVERALGGPRMLAIFGIGGVLANTGVVAWRALLATPEHFAPLLGVLAGSSGGLMAMLGALLVPSLLGRLGHSWYPERVGRQLDRGVLLPIAINIGICFVIPGWSAAINVAGAIAGIVVGLVLFVAPERTSTNADLVRFVGIGLLLAACVAGLAHSGDKAWLGDLRGEYDAWRTAHP